MTIFFVVALQSEANAIIDYFKLKLYCESPFKIYRKDNYFLVISGIGKLNCAAATSFLYSSIKDDTNQIWLNIGIAGHSNIDIGTAIIGHKITDSITSKNWYPPMLLNTKIKTKQIISVDVPETKYLTDSVYDMEAFAFYTIATKFTTSECVQVLKVISDNKDTPIEKITKEKIYQWLFPQMDIINEFINELQEITKQLPAKYPPEWQDFLEKWHFSIAGKKRLHNLLQKWHTLQPTSHLLETELFEKCKKMKEVLVIIEKALAKIRE